MLRQVPILSAGYVAGACLFIGCGQSQFEDRVVDVPPENQRMNSAIEAARGSLDDFRTAFQTPPAGAESFTVKKAFPVAGTTDGAEHIWVGVTRLDGENFVGIVDNVPVNDVGVAAGETVTVKPDEVSDWMYFVSPVDARPRLVGGFTMYAMHDILTGTELEDFKATFPFDLSGEPVTR